AMAPMTRSRALPDGTPGPLAAEYYTQRASLGLLISEGAQPSDDGQGYLLTPGLYTDRHIDGWRRITDAVHDAGGHLFVQLMHVGRVGHPDNTPHHRELLGPSAVATGEQIFTPQGLKDMPVPREMSIDEIRTAIADFAHGARCAIEAGADGVEIHGANGYLVQQFLSANANLRADEYGGSIENRARFAIETAAAVADAIGADRTGIRRGSGRGTVRHPPVAGLDVQCDRRGRRGRGALSLSRRRAREARPRVRARRAPRQRAAGSGYPPSVAERAAAEPARAAAREARRGHRIGSCRCHDRRTLGPCEPGLRRALSHRRAAQRAGPGDVLQRG